MTLDWKTTQIYLDNIETISRGDSDRILKYLNQFVTLIPERLNQLTIALAARDRVLIRQILHKMSPQLQFFGVQDIMVPIRRLEFEYETMSFEELDTLVKKIIVKLESAIAEVYKLIDSKF